MARIDYETLSSGTLKHGYVQRKKNLIFWYVPKICKENIIFSLLSENIKYS